MCVFRHTIRAFLNDFGNLFIRFMMFGMLGVTRTCFTSRHMRREGGSVDSLCLLLYLIDIHSVSAAQQSLSLRDGTHHAVIYVLIFDLEYFNDLCEDFWRVI